MSRRATSHAQGANRLHRTVPCLRLPRRQARLCSEGRRDSVDRVGLAMAASQLAVRAIDLHDGHAVGVQEARESRSVAAGPFDADAFDRTESPKPDERRAVAGRSRRERPYSELSATLVERGDPCWSRCVSAPAVTRVVGSAMVVIVIPSSEQPAEGWPHLPGRRTGQGRASVAGRDEKRAGSVGAHTVGSHELRSGGRDQRLEQVVESLALRVEAVGHENSRGLRQPSRRRGAGHRALVPQQRGFALTGQRPLGSRRAA